MQKMLGVMGLAAMCWSAQAVVLVYEGFDYPANGTKPLTGLVGQAGGTGFAVGGWGLVKRSETEFTLDAGIDDHGLTYEKGGIALVVTGNSIYSQLGVSEYQCDSLFRDLDLAAVLPDYKSLDGKLGKVDTTLWFSFLINLTVNPTHQVPPEKGQIIGWWAGLKATNSTGWFGRNANSSCWGVEFPKQDSPVAVTYGETVFLVMKVKFTAVSAETSLWVNPTPVLYTKIPAPPEAPAILNFAANAYTFDQLIYSSSCEGNFDEIRIGTSYYDVAPGKRATPPIPAPETTQPETPKAPATNPLPAP